MRWGGASTGAPPWYDLHDEPGNDGVGHGDLKVGNTLHSAGKYQASIELHERAARANPGSSLPYLLRDEDALRVWKRAEQGLGERFYDETLQVWGCRINGDRAGALRAPRQSVEQPQYRQEIFLHTFLKQNIWHDPVLDEPEFRELRSRMAMP